MIKLFDFKFIILLTLAIVIYFMYIDLSGLNSGNPVTWVYAGLVDSIPTWYQFYF